MKKVVIINCLIVEGGPQTKIELDEFGINTVGGSCLACGEGLVVSSLTALSDRPENFIAYHMGRPNSAEVDTVVTINT